MPSSTRTPTVLLLTVAALGLLARVPSIAEPLGIDQSLWASAANGMARGQVLYVDVFDQKPPGLFLTYLAAFSTFGWTAAAVAWLDILASTATTVLAFLIGRRLASPTVGALAAALYATLTMPSWLYRYGGFLERSVSETFVVIFVGLAALAAIGLRERTSLGLGAGLGLSMGAAVMFKPNAALYFPALWVWIALYGPRPLTTLVGPAIVSALACLVIPGVLVGWLASQGAWADTWIALVEFNRYYVGEGVTLAGFALAYAQAIWLRMKTDPLWMAGGASALVIGAALVRRERPHPLPALLACWGAAAALAILANGVRLYNSYFIQALPPLAIMAAWLLAGLARPVRLDRLAGGAVGVLMVLLLFVTSNYPARVYESIRADTDRLAGRMDDSAYLEIFGGYATGRGYSARANAELAEHIRTRTNDDDLIYLFGINGAGVYFLSDRLNANRFLRVNFFVPSGFPNPAFELSAVVEELRQKQPVYVVFETLHSTSDMARLVDALESDPIVQSLLADYTLETRIEDFSVYRRLR